MRDRPRAAELLEIAGKALAEEVAADLSARQRYNVALVASAVGIARREIEGGPTPWPGERRALEDLYGARNGESDEEALDRLNRRFAGDLRSGALDDDPRAAALLRNDVLARLAEDNPRYRKLA